VDVERGDSGRPWRVDAHLLLAGSSHGDASEENEGGGASIGIQRRRKGGESGFRGLGRPPPIISISDVELYML
jgi:hypothetical protein